MFSKSTTDRSNYAIRASDGTWSHKETIPPTYPYGNYSYRYRWETDIEDADLLNLETAQKRQEQFPRGSTSIIKIRRVAA